uniref:Tropomyosin n=1 Tax=Anopheles stephensi TaxID=30069 RepID=A0A182XV84_ANOST
MDAIKKKMQAMKLEKDNALDRALLCEQQARDANLRAEKAEEEARQLQKKIQAIENDLDQTQETLMQVNTKLEEKEKALQNRKPDCCSRPKPSRIVGGGGGGGGGGKGGKRKQHSKKDRQRWRRKRRGSEHRRRLPKQAEARMRIESGGRSVDALSSSKNKRPNNGFRTSIFELVDRTFDTKLWDRVGESADTLAAANKQDVVNGAADGGGSVVGASIMCENNSGPGPGTGGRKRGHQHHPRFAGTRQSTVPAEDVIAALRGAFDCGTNSLSSSSLSSSASSLNVSITGIGGGGAGAGAGAGGDRIVTGSDGTNNNDNNSNPLSTERTTIAKQSDDNDAELLDEYEIAGSAATADIVNSNIENNITALGVRWSGEPSKENTPEPEQDRLNNNRSHSSSNRSSVSPKNVIPLDEVADTDVLRRPSAAAAAAAAAALEQRASGDGASCDLDAVIGGLLGTAEYGGGLMAGDGYKEPANDENDPDVAEWAKLRCTSERTEVIAEREHRRQKRCADYPGLAFGRSIFSSDTMMKFNIIRNELHNIMKTQLKRAVRQQCGVHTVNP